MVQCQTNGQAPCKCSRLAQLASAVIFAFVAIVHGARIFMGTEILVSGQAVPTWVNVIIIVFATIMAIWNFCAICCKKCSKSHCCDSPKS